MQDIDITKLSDEERISLTKQLIDEVEKSQNSLEEAFEILKQVLEEFHPVDDAALKLSLAICLPQLGGCLRRRKSESQPSPTFTIASLRLAIGRGDLEGHLVNGKLTVTPIAVRNWLLKCSIAKPEQTVRTFVPRVIKSKLERGRAAASTELARSKLAALKTKAKR